MIKLPDLRTAQVEGKKVFLRADIDVPLSQQSTINNQQLTIGDDTRLKESLETLRYLLENGAKVILGGHLGRPEGKEDGLSAEPVAKWYANEFGVQSSEFRVRNIGEFEGWRINKNFFVLENLRFYRGEEKNDPVFSQKLSILADIYVNNAFADSHRDHSSIVGIAQILPHFAGFILKKEIDTLSTLMNNPNRPLTVVIGGAKIDTKLPVVKEMHQIADYVLIGGLIAGENKVLFKIQHENVNPPAGGRKSALIVADLNEDEIDITSTDVENFLQIINLSKTVIWNGPIGKTEGREKNLEIGSAKLARGIIDAGVFSVVGGGDTIGYLKKIGLLDKFSFVSTGGGAMLEFLSGENLPGIEALIS